MHSDLRGASRPAQGLLDPQIGASFKAAWMQMANVAGANATGSDWARADLRWATFPKADLQATVAERQTASSQRQPRDSRETAERQPRDSRETSRL